MSFAGGFTTQDGSKHEIEGRWDLIIAHPPCTYLSNAGACRLYPHKGELNKDRFINGLKAKLFFMVFWLCGWFGCGKIYIENPIPSRAFELPEKTQAIQPYEYGNPYTKKTYLWEFGLPKLKPTNIVKPLGPYVCGNSEIWKKQVTNGTVYGKGKKRSIPKQDFRRHRRSDGGSVGISKGGNSRNGFCPGGR